MKRLNNRQQIALILILWSCLFLVGCVEKETQPTFQGSPIQKEFNKGPLQVQLSLDTDQVLLSELLGMQITVQSESGYEVILPDLAEKLEDFRIRDWQEESKKLLVDDVLQSSRHYRLEPLKTGQLQIPPLEFQFTKKTDSQMEQTFSTLITDSIVINVNTTIQGNLEEVTIADIENVVEMKRGIGWIWIPVVAMLILAGIPVGIWFLQPKKNIHVRKIYKPAHEIALEWIRKLAAQKLLEQGHVKEFYERLSNCLRHYIENRFSLRAPEQTTEEFLNDLKDSPVLESEHKKELRKFLEHCDLVKFAKYQPTRQQSDQSLEMAERFIENTKSDESLVEVGYSRGGK